MARIRWPCLALCVPAAAALLGASSCGAKRSTADAGTVIEVDVGAPDDAAPACLIDGWCWEHGEDSAVADAAAPVRLNGAWSSGPNDQWVVGTRGTVLHKVGGAWVRVYVGSDASLNGVWGTGPNDVWIVGAFGTILHKDGSNWFEVVVPTTLALNAIWGSASDDFWIAGDGGTILHRQGASWFMVNSGTTSSLRAGWGSGMNDVWAVGDRGEILHWDGTRGSSSSSGTTRDLLAVGGTGPMDAWAVGREGIILHWNGTAWSPFATNAPSDATLSLPTLQGVGARRRDDVWAVGSAGTVLHWNGIRWAPDNSGTSRDLFAVRAEGNDPPWAAGDREAILRRGTLRPGGEAVAPNGGDGPSFEPGPTNCSPMLILRFFSAGSTPIEGVAAIVVRLDQGPGSYSMITFTSPPSTIYPDRSTGVSYCVSDKGTQTMTVELRDRDGCSLGTVTTMAYLLDDVTALDFVFASQGCIVDAGAD